MKPILNSLFRHVSNLKHDRLRGGLLLVFVALAGIGVVSCANVGQVTISPQIPGATYVGSEECEQCHKEQFKDFSSATHYHLKAPGDNAKNIGCESCHGAGSKHVESGGAPNTIINPRKSPETCFQCHLDKKAQFNLPSHHPVLEGKISCGDCHDPHKGNVIAGGTELMGKNEICAKCHTQQMGPFVFEHEAMREGCTTCHNPHGSVNARLLIARNATLCLRCHLQSQTTPGALLIGDNNHAGAGAKLTTGTCWNAGCHEAVHGSQVSPHLRY